MPSRVKYKMRGKNKLIKKVATVEDLDAKKSTANVIVQVFSAPSTANVMNVKIAILKLT